MKPLPFIVIALLTLGCGAIPWPPLGSTFDTDGKAGPDGHARLDHAVAPVHYALEFTIDPRKKTFSGRARIKIRLEAATQRVQLHGLGLTIREARVEVGGELRAAKVIEGANGGLALSVDESIPAGEATVVIAYQAPLPEIPDGVYRVKDGDGWYVFTQFEPLYARQAFPGFDQPSFKTPYAVTLRVPKGMTALANSRETGRNDEADWTVFTFAETKPLPTYLVAFAVGTFDIVEAPADAIPETPLRLIATKGKGKLASYALERTPIIHKVLSEYFDQPHPFDKLDLVAVPNFAAGAMENVGLVTFREPLLLLDPKTAPANRRMWSQSVIAHELAHMWFGNLVTPMWWDDLWLNEAFATWMASWVVHMVDPALGVDLERVANTAYVMELDSQVHTRAVRQPISSGGDVHNAFDGITYGKGAAVLRMLESWTGRAPFRDGVREYIRVRPYGSATTGDLIAALETATGEPVGETARLFLDQPGTPLVNMRLTCKGPKDAARVVLTQTRALPAGSKAPVGDPWRIPVCLRYGIGDQIHRECFVLDATTKTVTLGHPGCPISFVGNDDQRGYYQWTTDQERVLALAGEGYGTLTNAEQVSLPGMFGALLEADALSLDAYLDTLKRLAPRSNRLVIRGVVDGLERLHRTAVDGANREAFAALVREYLSPHAERIGWHPAAEEPVDNKLLRPQIISPLAYLGRHEGLMAEANEITERLLDEPESVSGELATLFLHMAAWDGDAALWDRFRIAVGRTSDPVTRVAIVKALGSFRDPTLLTKSLDLILDGTLRAQDFSTLKRGVGVFTQDAAWMWMTRNYDQIIERMGPTHRPYLPWMAHGFCDHGDRERVAAFFAKPERAPPGTARNLGQVMERISRCVRQRSMLRAPFSAWLAARPVPGAAVPEDESAPPDATPAPTAPLGTPEPAPTPAAIPAKGTPDKATPTQAN